MEYERIHSHKLPQVGIISPSKLRMKLMGGQKKKDGGSKSNSARTSPVKLQVEDTDQFVNNSLLASTNSGVSDEEVSSMGISSVTFDSTQVDQSLVNPKDHTKDTRVKPHQFQKPDSSNSSSVHPLRSLEDENLDYDSNASSSSFEFHKGERSTHNPISRSLLRPMSSKWNDAEKWIINKQIIQHHNQKNNMQNRANRGSVKRVDFCQPALQTGTERFSFTPSQPQQDTVSSQTTEGNKSTNPCPESKDLLEIDTSASSCPEVRSVSMRDMGTEMTPIPSQEPSTTSTPIGATTPLRSPVSSMPSTPRRGGPTSTPIDQSNPKELTAEEVKLRTRKEILQLGVQLGKMNIAAWASKEDMEKNASDIEADNMAEEALRIEFEKRAIAWEEAEKTKHNARFIREEIKIQAWESQQKAKLETEMRRIEAEVEQRRANAQAKMLKKIAMARQKSEAKREAAESLKNRQAARAAAQAEYIRQTGRIPPRSPNSCCGWS
ncbi:Remorin, C-terminal [Artemisia annua]|uniref:Remorin, C-terminal n=1 Tax=Artemisia annua TaxID=35608 RepID=A0A2U1L7L0_ARTAN|nr:Remorin, C-terminal [Artemisia annua]